MARALFLRRVFALLMLGFIGAGLARGQEVRQVGAYVPALGEELELRAHLEYVMALFDTPINLIESPLDVKGQVITADKLVAEMRAKKLAGGFTKFDEARLRAAEEAAQSDGKTAVGWDRPRRKVVFAGGTLAQLLDAVCVAFPEYKYEVSKFGVTVRPKVLSKEYEALVDVALPGRTLHACITEFGKGAMEAGFWLEFPAAMGSGAQYLEEFYATKAGPIEARGVTVPNVLERICQSAERKCYFSIRSYSNGQRVWLILPMYPLEEYMLRHKGEMKAKGL